MSRVLAVLVALCALLAPSVAQAQGRLDARVPARALLGIESSGGSCVGSAEFLQRDPSGYADSVNVYAAMGNDPINHRDPTGRLRVDADLRAQFPLVAELINSLWLRLSALQASVFTELTGVDAARLRAALTPNQGPRVRVADVPSACGVARYSGEYYPDIDETLSANTIFLDAAFLHQIETELEGGANTSRSPAHPSNAPLTGNWRLDGTVLHEVTHFFESKLTEKYSETGQEYTRRAFGGDPCTEPTLQSGDRDEIYPWLRHR